MSLQNKFKAVQDLLGLDAPGAEDLFEWFAPGHHCYGYRRYLDEEGNIPAAYKRAPEIRQLQIGELLDHLLWRGRWCAVQPDALLSCAPPPTGFLCIDLDAKGRQDVDLIHRFDVVREILGEPPVTERSSWSGGLHLWWFFQELVPAKDLWRHVHRLLTQRLEVRDGLVEIYPNPSRGLIRLPLGPGSLLLDPATLQPQFGLGRRDQVHGLVELLDKPGDHPQLLPLEHVDGHSKRRRSARHLRDYLARFKGPGVTCGPARERSFRGVPQLIQPGEGTWRDAQKIMFRGIKMVHAQGINSRKRGWGMVKHWLSDPKNAGLSESLSNPVTGPSRMLDLLSAFEWCWPRVRLQNGLQERTTASMGAWIEQVTESYLAMFPAKSRRRARPKILAVLKDLAAFGDASNEVVCGGKVVYLGREFWCRSKDGVTRCNRRTAPTNSAYYVRVRDYLITQGILEKHTDAVPGLKATSYLFRLPQTG